VDDDEFGQMPCIVKRPGEDADAAPGCQSKWLANQHFLTFGAVVHEAQCDDSATTEEIFETLL
jgi:hypothetical protein